MQVFAKPFVDMFIVEPQSGLPVHLFGGGLEHNEMSSVLNGRHIRIQRFPVIGHDDPLTELGGFGNGQVSKRLQSSAECLLNQLIIQDAPGLDGDGESIHSYFSFASGLFLSLRLCRSLRSGSLGFGDRILNADLTGIYPRLQFGR